MNRHFNKINKNTEETVEERDEEEEDDDELTHQVQCITLRKKRSQLFNLGLLFILFSHQNNPSSLSSLFIHYLPLHPLILYTLFVALFLSQFMIESLTLKNALYSRQLLSQLN